MNASPVRRRLIENFVFLFMLQGMTYVLPLIVVPYLARTLIPRTYGLVLFAQSIAQYLVVFTDYGFNLSATREISLHRDNCARISHIFSAVLAIKVGLLALSCGGLLVLTTYIESLRNDREIFWLSFGVVIGGVLFPTWYYQGIEKMKYIAAMSISTKLLSTLMIFLLVKGDEDYLYVPFLYSLGSIIAGVAGLVIPLVALNVKLAIPPVAEIRNQLAQGWYIFISTFSVTCYRILPSVILGLSYDYSIVGYYRIGEQIIRALCGLIQPFAQTIFPHMSRAVAQSAQSGLEFAFRLLPKLNTITLACSVTTLLLAEWVVKWFAGPEYVEAATVLRILSFLPFIVGIANVYGVQIMLNIGLQRQFSMIIGIAGAGSLLLLILVTPIYSVIGAAIVVLFTECSIMLAMYAVTQRTLAQMKSPVRPVLFRASL